MTSIEALTGGRVDMETVKRRFVKEMERIFDIEIK